ETVETYEISYPSSQFSITATLENDSCNINQGFIELVITGGTGDYSYVWSSGATTQNIYSLSAGIYNVTITDNISGYMQSESYIIDNIGGYTISYILTSAMCPSCNDGAINLTIAGSSGYTFIWDNSATTEDILGLLPGSYTVTISDIAGCEMVETYNVGYQPNQLFAVATIADDSCNLAQGYIELIINGGSDNYSYNWSTTATTQDIYNLAIGTYDVTITDNITGYTLLESFYVNNIGSFTVTEIIANATCGTCSNGSINLTLSGSSGYTYNWSNGASTEDISGLISDNYIVTISDIAGCEVIETYVVAYPQYQLTVSATVADDSCNTAQAYIELFVNGGTGDYSYLWSTGATTSDIYNLTAGTYNVTITDNITGYILTESYTINFTGSFTVSSGVSDASCGTCSDGTINQTVTGSSNYTFIWNNGATFEDLTNLLPGTYVVTITDGINCEQVITYTIGYPANLLTVTETVDNDSCNNALGFIEITISGGSGNYSYSWSNGAISQNIYSLTDGIYDVTVTDNVTSYSVIESYTVNNIGTFTLNANVSDATCGTCNDGGIDQTLTGSSNYTFIWSNAEITEDLTDLLPGTYTVTIYDIGGCEMVETYYLGYPSNLLTAIATVTDDTCSASIGSIVLTVSGGTGNYSYNWSNGATSQNLYNISFGTYYLTITDDITAYTYTDCYIVNFLGNYAVSSVISNATCSICPDGSIDLTITGTGTYTFYWNTGDTNEDLFNLLPGTYWVTVTDDLGCEYIESFIIDFAISITDEDGLFLLTIYPNPNKGEFTLELTNTEIENVFVEIMDIRGLLIETRELRDIYYIKEKFDLSDLAMGIYYIRVISGTNIRVEKVLVQ
ncbi:MAG: T9SS type A sorting domain-containing protein, partial [Bacteroidota bacterium]